MIGWKRTGRVLAPESSGGRGGRGSKHGPGGGSPGGPVKADPGVETLAEGGPQQYQTRQLQLQHRCHCPMPSFRGKALRRAEAADAAEEGGGKGKGGAAGGAARKEGHPETEGGALFRSWEPVRTARLFASWLLEAALIFLAIRVMLW